MGHKSWGGARPNKWDIYQHEEPQGERFYVLEMDGKFCVFDGDTDELVLQDDDESIAQCECDFRNSLEKA